MTNPQILSVSVLLATVALFLWGRLRYDIVAALALLAAVAVGIVPVKEAFSGFSDDVVIIVASALVVSAAIARSGVMEQALRVVAPYATTTRSQVLVLAGSVAILSAFIKNIGALAMLMPVAFQLAQRHGKSPSIFLMPMAFAALLGGVVTLVGTSPNIIVARLRAELVGEPFGMFDFAPVGIGVTLFGVAFLAVGYRLLPGDRRGAATLDQAIDIQDYVTEARVTKDSLVLDASIAELRRLSDDTITPTAILRDGKRAASPLPDATLREGDVLMLRGEPKALERLVSAAKLELEGEDRRVDPDDPTDEVGTVEAVIGPGSILVGISAGRIGLHERFGVNLLAVSRSNKRFTKRLRDIKLRSGDVVVLRGPVSSLPARLGDLGLLPLVTRNLPLGTARRGWVPVTILAVTIGLVGSGIVPVALGFFAAAAALVLFRTLGPRDAYDAIEWPIIVMLAALIPVSDTLRSTGATDLFAAWLAGVAGSLPAWGAVTLIMVAAMAVTPFLNNAATVLVMAPIAAGFAKGLGYRPDAFLIAVALGAASDFLTPIGHQCNTLVMGPGGYRFGDYARLGFPLSVLVVAVGVPLILLVWPLR